MSKHLPLVNLIRNGHLAVECRLYYNLQLRENTEDALICDYILRRKFYHNNLFVKRFASNYAPHDNRTLSRLSLCTYCTLPKRRGVIADEILTACNYRFMNIAKLNSVLTRQINISAIITNL